MLSLKEATAQKHKIAERMPFNVRMFLGVLTKQEYLLYLKQQLLIFQTLEKTDLPHADLNRCNNLLVDINELEAQGYKSDLVLSSTTEYVDYLQSLSYPNKLPHIYLNYLALLFGGQIIKKRVPSTGKLYDFNNGNDALEAVRKVQKDEWADEVNKGFDFTIRILEELETACQLKEKK